MLGIRKTYVSKSPAGSRPSISAAAAHTCFWKDLKLDAASRAVQASILQMHSLVREKVGGTPYLVIMASTFAARVWRADERDGFPHRSFHLMGMGDSSGHGGLGVYPA